MFRAYGWAENAGVWTAENMYSRCLEPMDGLRMQVYGLLSWLRTESTRNLLKVPIDGKEVVMVELLAEKRRYAWAENVDVLDGSRLQKQVNLQPLFYTLVENTSERMGPKMAPNHRPR